MIARQVMPAHGGSCQDLARFGRSWFGTAPLVLACPGQARRYPAGLVFPGLGEASLLNGAGLGQAWHWRGGSWRDLVRYGFPKRVKAGPGLVRRGEAPLSYMFGPSWLVLSRRCGSWLDPARHDRAGLGLAGHGFLTQVLA